MPRSPQGAPAAQRSFPPPSPRQRRAAQGSAGQAKPGQLSPRPNTACKEKRRRDAGPSKTRARKQWDNVSINSRPRGRGGGAGAVRGREGVCVVISLLFSVQFGSYAILHASWHTHCFLWNSGPNLLTILAKLKLYFFLFFSFLSVC